MLYTQLRSFHAVATEGGFTAASKVLFIGQPTITSQVKALEEHYNVELFHRRGRRVSLTEAGLGLFDITKRMMAQESEALDYLNALSGFHTGHLRLGAVGPFHATEMVAAFNERYPDLTLSVELGNSAEMLQKLLDFRVDIAVLSQVEVDPRFFAQPVSCCDIVAFLRRDHALVRKARKGGVTLKQLANETLVIREPGSTTRVSLDHALRRQDLTPQRTIEIGSREAVWMAVQKGLGVGVVSELEHTPQKDMRTLKITDCDLKMTDHLVCLAERREARMVDAFFKVAQALPQFGAPSS